MAALPHVHCEVAGGPGGGPAGPGGLTGTSPVGADLTGTDPTGRRLASAGHAGTGLARADAVGAGPGSAGAADTVLIGRAAEVELLRSAVCSMDDGAQLAEVAGDPGTGTTRLLDEFCRLAARAGRVVLSGRATAVTATPFALLLDVLAPVSSQALPGLARLGGPAGLAGPASPALGGGWRQRLYQSGAALLEQAGAGRGVVVVLDEVHLADSGSAGFADYLMRHPPAVPFALALGYRPRQLPPSLARALGQLTTMTRTRIRLRPLAAGHAAALLGDAAGPARCRALHEASGGNLHYLQALSQAGETAPWTALRDPESVFELYRVAALPGAVDAELAALPPSVAMVAGAAAVAGERFDPELVAEASGISGSAALAGLAELAARDLIRPAGQATWFRYRHPLLRAAAYQLSDAGWRARAHGRTAAMLERRGAPAPVRAAHLARVAVPGDDAAIRLLARAAEAVCAAQPDRAAHWLGIAAGLLPAAGPVTMPVTELAAEPVTGPAGSAAGHAAGSAAKPGTGSAAQHKTAMRSAAESVAEPVSEPARCPEPDSRRAALMLGRARALAACGQLGDSRELAREALGLLAACPPARRVPAALACAAAERMLGHYDAAARLLVDTLAANTLAADALAAGTLAGPQSGACPPPGDARLTTATHRDNSKRPTGHSSDNSKRVGGRHGQGDLGCAVRAELALVRVRQGRFAEARDLTRLAVRSLARGDLAGLSARSAAMFAVHAAADSQTGCPASARRDLRLAAAVLDALPDEGAADWLTLFTEVSRAELALDQHPAALRHAARGAGLAARAGHLPLFAELSLLLAAAQLRLGRLAEADGSARDVAEAGARLGTPELGHCAAACQAGIALWRGEARTGLALAQRAADSGVQAGDYLWRGYAQVVLGWAWLENGQPGQARQVLTGRGPGLPGFAAAVRPQVYDLLVQAELADGDLAAARRWAGQAAAASAGLGLLGASGYALLARARTLLAGGPAISAMAAAQDAAAGFARLGWPGGEGQARHLLGTVLAAAGVPGQAQQEWGRAKELFGACGAQRMRAGVLNSQRRLAARMPRRRRSAGGSAGLTAREREIAGMVSAGRTNRQIAERLFLSTKTIETHLTHIFAKLGVTSRSAVAGLVAQLDEQGM